MDMKAPIESSDLVLDHVNDQTLLNNRYSLNLVGK